MIRQKTFHKSISCFIACLLLLGRLSFAYSQAENLKIGVSLSLTGPAAHWTKYQLLGIRLAQSDLMGQGSRINLVIEDSKTDAKTAVSNFYKLVNVDHVQGVIGDIFSYLTEPLIPLADQKNVILVSPATPAAFCAKSKGHFFSSATQVPLAIRGYELFLERIPVRRIALIYFQDPGWGYQYRDGWRRIAKEKGLEIVDEFESADFNPDFRAVLPRILAKKPDVFFVAQQPDGFIAAARELGYRGPMVFANNILEMVALGKNKSGVTDGIYFVDTLADADFVKRFEARFKEPPLLEAYNGYEALRAIVKALQTDAKRPEQALRRLRYQGVSGILDFTQVCAGNQSPWHLKWFRGGAIEVLE